MRGRSRRGGPGPVVALALVAVLLLLAGCQTPGAAGVDAGEGLGTVDVPDAEPDPPSDRLGWENGVWYDESLSTLPAGQRRDAVVARAKARVEHIRRLEFQGQVSIDVVSRATYRNSSGGRLGDARRRFDNAKFATLFLVGRDADSVATQRDTRNQTVQGYYSPARDAIVVVADADARVLQDELVLAHELVHALQDQHFANASARDGPAVTLTPTPTASSAESTASTDDADGDGNYSVDARTRDTVQGRNALFEGDPMVVQWSYADRCDANWTCRMPGGATPTPDDTESGPGTTPTARTSTPAGDGTGDDGASGDGTTPSRTHFGIQVLDYFPYSDGWTYVQALRERGGWAAVNEAYADPPDGAAEAIDPSRYPDWEPEPVALGGGADGDWERVRPAARVDWGVPGQSAIAAAYAYTAVDDYAPREAVVQPRELFAFSSDGTLDREDPFRYDPPGARGWAGGRLHVYWTGNGTGNGTGDAIDTASVWRTRWTSDAHADLFGRTWAALIRHWDGERVANGTYVVADGPFAPAAVLVERSGRTVTVTTAPDRAALAEVRDE